MSDKPLTQPQRRLLGILAESERAMSPRSVAEAMWPDSKAWDRRTYHRGTNRNGAMGGTMPMKAATMLWRLWPVHVQHAMSWDGSTNGLWEITPAGRKAIEVQP